MASLFFSALLALVCCAVASVPAAHVIDNVPYHRQDSDFGCGDASLQMVLGHFNVSTSQRVISNAVRTTGNEGTLSVDIWRAAFFSSLSAAQGCVYPAPLQLGWTQTQNFGLLSSWHDMPCSAPSPWLDELRQLIASDFPVVLLTHYDPDNYSDGDGHFRVLIGFNTTQDSWTLLNPWDRDGFPPVEHFDTAKLIRAWNYSEPLSPRPRTQCYFGATIFPLHLQLQMRGFALVAQARYPVLPAALKQNVLELMSPRLQLSYSLFDAEMNSTKNNASTGFVDIPITPADKSSVKIAPSMGAGESMMHSWKFQKTLSYNQARRYQFRVVFSGFVEGSIERAPWNSTNYSPAYEFQDAVGVISTIQAVL